MNSIGTSSMNPVVRLIEQLLATVPFLARSETIFCGASAREKKTGEAEYNGAKEAGDGCTKKHMKHAIRGHRSDQQKGEFHDRSRVLLSCDFSLSQASTKVISS